MPPDQTSTDANVASPNFRDKDQVEGDHAVATVRAVMINRPRAELYTFWRDFQNLPRFMANVKGVELLESGRSRWMVAGPGGKDVELISQITEDSPGEKIAWRSTEGSDIDHEGWVSFKDNPFGRGTEVRVFISYDPPGGVIGKLVAKVLQKEPAVQARHELRRFKQLMETGEIPTSKAPEAAPRGSFS